MNLTQIQLAIKFACPEIDINKMDGQLNKHVREALLILISPKFIKMKNFVYKQHLKILKEAVLQLDTFGSIATRD